MNSAPRLKLLWRWMFITLDGLLMRDEIDANRMRQITNAVGAMEAKNKVLMLGDVKLDEVSSLEEQRAVRDKWREILKINDDELLWVCGSTHPAKKESESSEEEIALHVFNEFKCLELKLAQESHLRLLVAPRHIERCDKVYEWCHVLYGPVISRSEIEGSDGDEIIVLDTVGELSEIYAAADVAFVGGSLVSRGGHNVLEPVLRGVPVLFGPHMNNFRAAANFVETEKLGAMVRDENELKAQVEYWLREEQARREIPRRARIALEPHQGAAARIAQHIAQRLKSKPEK